MASYYYLMSSLPDLKADGEMPLTYEEFLNCCRGNVDEENMELLERLTLSKAEGPLAAEWSQFYGMITGEMNYQRSINLGRSYPQNYDKDSSVAQVVSSALSAKNPLEAENILLEYEFENLDLLAGAHMFDAEGLFGYAIKLKLLERRSCFKHEKGKAEFQSLFDEIQKQVYNL